MNDDIVEQVSKLLKNKIALEEDLQQLLSKNEIFVLAFSKPSRYEELNYSNNLKQPKFINKIKYLVILEVQKEIEKLEEEIKKLKYY